jgi:hypothetical protein
VFNFFVAMAYFLFDTSVEATSQRRKYLAKKIRIFADARAMTSNRLCAREVLNRRKAGCGEGRMISEASRVIQVQHKRQISCDFQSSRCRFFAEANC